YYERVIDRQMSIEVGIGLLLPYYGYEFPGSISINQVISDPDGGYSIWIHPKYHFIKAQEGSYFGFQYRRRSYNENGSNIIYSDYTINFGFQLILGTRYIMDINWGLGYRYKQVPDGFLPWTEEFDKTSLVAPFGIRLGILF
ncbi:MAG: hypothetical protein K8S00_12965, partial [Bacteroidales bacterium]|nr:hypothetical protein [Bacteroidales bacterium]